MGDKSQYLSAKSPTIIRTTQTDLHLHFTIDKTYMIIPNGSIIIMFHPGLIHNQLHCIERVTGLLY